jgi:DNA polymerase (family 10)
MENYIIAENFSLLGKLMDIHGDNSFKAKSYASASFTIDKLPTPLAGMPADKIAAIRGIGDSVAKKILEQLETGHLGILDEYLQRTPAGILEMLTIKGIGPKKIATIWKELEIESLGELLYACNENRLTLYKGFGEKTQKNIKEAIEFYMNNQGSYLYQEIEIYAEHADGMMKRAFPDEHFVLTGEFRRQMEVINKLEWVTTASVQVLKNRFSDLQIKNVSTVTSGGKTIKETVLEQTFEIMTEDENYLSIQAKGTNKNIVLGFYSVPKENLYTKLFQTSCSEEFLNEWNTATQWDTSKPCESEDLIFAGCGMSAIPVYAREKAGIIQSAKNGALADVIQPGDITGIIHSHSNWSDGVHTLEMMALHAREKGLQFLVISDHSKTAFYANGLSEERIRAQHQQVDELNAKLAPFRIFKSIESDILNDGSLDYAPDVLNSFDLVIASVHSNLKMTEEKAMMRLLKAIENPYTSILGHMTGRLLLSRNGYPVDHKKIIEACAANNVVIELNAHPRRLDMDWRWMDYALDKGVLISIDPDAHSIEGFDDCRYGVLSAQKAGLPKEKNLSSFSLADFEAFIAVQKSKRNQSFPIS